MTTGTSEFEVAHDATISAPPQKVFDLLVDFHRWREKGLANLGDAAQK